jgi:hypothetical protein
MEASSLIKFRCHRTTSFIGYQAAKVKANVASFYAYNIVMDQKQSRTLQIQSRILLVFLVVEYAFGMYTNLFISFPDDASGGTAWQFAWSSWPIIVHVILGVLLGIGSFVFVIRTIRYKSSAWKIPATLGLVGIFAAALFGSEFIPSQNDPLSYGMSLSFLLAFFSYFWGMVSARREATRG